MKGRGALRGYIEVFGVLLGRDRPVRTSVPPTDTPD